MQAIRNIVDGITYPFRMLARIPSNVISSPRRMLGLSLPVRSALLLFLGLLILVIIWSILRWNMDDAAQASRFLRVHLPIAIFLICLIPLVIWYLIKLFLEGEPSPFPEIDRVWKDAQAAMAEQAIDPTNAPIFLVLGIPTADAGIRFFSASNLPLPVCVPRGPGPFHVYANQQSIYIVCTETSCVGSLLGGPAGPSGIPVDAPPQRDLGQTLQVGPGGVGGGGVGGGGVGAMPDPAFSPGATMLKPFGLGNAPSPRAVANPVAMPGAFAQGGTMMVGGGGEPRMPVGGPAVDIPIERRLNPGQAGEATAKLAYLCHCLKRLRDPQCPINGVIVTTPFKLLADGSQQAVNQLQVALKADLAVVRAATRVRCSVVHLVDGMEQEEGFREFISRIDADRVASQRFGKGFGLWNVPAPDQLDAVVRHACGAFEDWSYLLFRQADGLSKRGNRHLYGLLCRIRKEFVGRLAHLVSSVYAIEPESKSQVGKEPMLFSGCYFIAAGQTLASQGFLKGVFDKAQSEEEELEWGSEAIREEERMQTGVRILIVIIAALLVLNCGLLIGRWFELW